MGKSEPLARAVGYLSAGLQLQCKQQPRVMPVKSVCSGRIARIKPNRTPHSRWGGGLQSAPPALFAFTWSFQSRPVRASLSVCSVLGNVYAIVAPSWADPVGPPRTQRPRLFNRTRVPPGSRWHAAIPARWMEGRCRGVEMRSFNVLKPAAVLHLSGLFTPRLRCVTTPGGRAPPER